MRTNGHNDSYGRPQRGNNRPRRENMGQQKQWEEPDSPVYREMKAQLTEYYRRGVKVSLGGVRMPVSRIARICAVREEGKYMCDYIVDESGQLTEVRFDRVSRD